MKTTTLLLALALMVSSCTSTMDTFEPHRQNGHRTGTPRFSARDTVYNWRNGLTYVIDSPEYQAKHPGQVFYAAHDTRGWAVKWLPERSIEKL
jgi:hypothetical protein